MPILGTISGRKLWESLEWICVSANVHMTWKRISGKREHGQGRKEVVGVEWTDYSVIPALRGVSEPGNLAMQNEKGRREWASRERATRPSSKGSTQQPKGFTLWVYRTGTNRYSRPSPWSWNLIE
jgi:hypothetical protein